MDQAENPNVTVVRRYFDEVYNQGKEEILPELVTEDYIDYGHAEPGKGVEGAKQDLQLLLGGFDQVHYTIDGIIAAGDTVGAYWTGTMRHKAELMGIPATGKTVSYKGMSIYKFRDGKIAETHNVQDFASVFQQLQATS